MTNDEQARDFISWAQTHNKSDGTPYSKQEIFSALDKLTQEGMSVNIGESPLQSAAIARQPVAPDKPWSPETTAHLIRGGTTALGSTLGGLGVGLLTGGPGALPGEIGGASIGRAVGNYLTGKPAMHKVPETAIGTAIGGVGTRLLSKGMNAIAEIPPLIEQHVATSNPAKAFSLTRPGSATASLSADVLPGPSTTAHLELGQQIQQGLGKVMSELTQGRAEKEAINTAADKTVRIPMKSVVDAIRSQKIQNAAQPEAQAFNTWADKFANSLAAKARKGMTPSQFDRFMIDQIDEKTFNKAGDVGSTQKAQALAAVRKVAKELYESTLEKSGFPLIRQANASAAEELTFRAEADKVFGPGKLSLEQRLANLFKPNHEAEQKILKRIGESMDPPVDLLSKAKDLTARTLYGGDPRTIQETMGLFRQLFAAPVAKGIAKVVTPVSRYGGGAAVGQGAANSIAAFEEAMKRKSP